MKKLLVFTLMACASASALRADFICTNEWFKAIGPTASAWGSLNPVNGSWADNSGSVEFSEGSLNFELEDDDCISFSVDLANPVPDTNTVTDVTVSGVFTPVVGNDLPVDATMNTRGAQVGFLVQIYENATNYMAWVGTGGWIALTNAAADAGANIEGETTLLVKFDYTVQNAPKAKFGIVCGGATNYLGNSNGDTAIALSTSKRVVQGISCYGSGSIRKADGTMGLGYAELNGVKYGSIADAVADAAADATIEVLRDTDEAVEINKNIVFNDAAGHMKGEVTVDSGTEVDVVVSDSALPAGGASGSCEIPLGVKGEGSFEIVLPSSVSAYKEAAHVTKGANSVTFDLRTKTEFVTNAIPTGAKKLAADPEGLHRFLAANNDDNRYTKADAGQSDIEAILNAGGDNGIKKWQSYVLGIASNDPVVPVTAAADTDPENITLSIPAIDTSKYSGDYASEKISYQVGGQTVTDPAAIKVPLTTGTYTITINFAD